MPQRFAKMLLVTWLALIAPAFGGIASAGSFELPYTGRLTQTDGKPYAGTVDLEISFWSAPNSNAPLGLAVFPFDDVKLADGVFQVTVTLTPSHRDAVFGAGDEVYVQIQDKTHNVTHARQRLMAVPFALRVPVDGTSLKWDDQGRLSVDPTKLPAPSLEAGDVLGLGIHTSSPTCGPAQTGNLWFQNGELVYCDGTGPQIVVTTTTTLIDASNIGGGGVTTTEFNYLSSVTSNVQTQFDIHTTNIAENATNIATNTAEIDSITNDLAGKANSVHAHSTLAATDNSPPNAVSVDGDGNVGIGTATPGAILDVASTTSGVLLPRVTTTERLAIATPAAGLEVYDTTANLKMVFNGTRWLEVGSAPIGTIQAWHGSLPGVPTLPWGWVLCGGQTLADAESPLNGQVITNLNGGVGYFLRGGATSGTLQAATAIGDRTAFANNVAIGGADYVDSSAAWNQYGTGNNQGATITYYAVRPINMSVRWIMRVK